jgi:hypothetical protein
VNALILANFPLAVLFMLAIVGIPLWMTFKRPETTPDYAEAQAYYRARSRGGRTLAAVGGAPYAGLTPARVPADQAARPTRAAA